MSKGRPPPTRTPQEKKRLSLAKNGRNAHGNSDKAARKAIPLRKAVENRRSRHQAAQDLSALGSADEARADALESSIRRDIYRTSGWIKGADMPLGQWIVRQARSAAGRAFRRAKPRGKAGPSDD